MDDYRVFVKSFGELGILYQLQRTASSATDAINQVQAQLGHLFRVIGVATVDSGVTL